MTPYVKPKLSSHGAVETITQQGTRGFNLDKTFSAGTDLFDLLEQLPNSLS